jgi:hypothetical protein
MNTTNNLSTYEYSIAPVRWDSTWEHIINISGEIRGKTIAQLRSDLENNELSF